jgi:hypothetical protein
MDLLMKKLDERDQQKKEVMHIHDSRMTCEKCGGTSHIGSNFPEVQEDVNYINNNTNHRPQQNQGWNQQNQGWNQQQRSNYPGNYSSNYQGNNFNQPPLREMIVNQNKVIDNMSRKIASNDKVLETINNRMNIFTSAIKNQLSFNKMIESQISQLAASVPVAEKVRFWGIQKN